MARIDRNVFICGYPRGPLHSFSWLIVRLQSTFPDFRLVFWEQFNERNLILRHLISTRRFLDTTRMHIKESSERKLILRRCNDWIYSQHRKVTFMTFIPSSCSLSAPNSRLLSSKMKCGRGNDAHSTFNKKIVIANSRKRSRGGRTVKSKFSVLPVSTLL